MKMAEIYCEIRHHGAGGALDDPAHYMVVGRNGSGSAIFSCPYYEAGEAAKHLADYVAMFDLAPAISCTNLSRDERALFLRTFVSKYFTAKGLDSHL